MATRTEGRKVRTAPTITAVAAAILLAGCSAGATEPTADSSAAQQTDGTANQQTENTSAEPSNSATESEQSAAPEKNEPALIVSSEVPGWAGKLAQESGMRPVAVIGDVKSYKVLGPNVAGVFPRPDGDTLIAAGEGGELWDVEATKSAEMKDYFITGSGHLAVKLLSEEGGSVTKKAEKVTEWVSYDIKTGAEVDRKRATQDENAYLTNDGKVQLTPEVGAEYVNYEPMSSTRLSDGRQAKYVLTQEIQKYQCYAIVADTIHTQKEPMEVIPTFDRNTSCPYVSFTDSAMVVALDDGTVNGVTYEGELLWSTKLEAATEDFLPAYDGSEHGDWFLLHRESREEGLRGEAYTAYNLKTKKTYRFDGSDGSKTIELYGGDGEVLLGATQEDSTYTLLAFNPETDEGETFELPPGTKPVRADGRYWLIGDEFATVLFDASGLIDRI